PAAAAALPEQLRTRLQPIGADAASIDALAAALLALRADPLPAERLARMRARGTLRVGTTGDYAPFSAVAANGERTGIDVDRAGELAASLGVRVDWIETSWPTLEDDLAAGRFDIAMSGISRTLERARIGDFSAPYHVGGKTPIVRCEDLARFDAFEAIDRPGTRAVVNPGGTNEQFARTRLTQASLRVFPDNRLVFDEIAEGRADVMFTDAIEVHRVARDDARLCAALPGVTLTYQEKGFLLPRDRDGAWLRYVDLWLAQLRGDGRLDAAFARHLGSSVGD
ncbi:MAG: transporter substrate-binding domain-containing protein, partial [Pseudomonadales bacterium]|nr:transporter substrate-binding domain-containing protein [Pseudomonadales bacterium]